MNNSVYFIAIIPDLAIAEEVRAFKKYALAHFESGRALRSPAHITLEPPFKWKDENYELLEKAISSFAKQQEVFDIDLQDFDHFASKVIFIDVLKNEKLRTLHETLKFYLRSNLQLVSDRPEGPFHPHMTIAFKDLKKGQFEQAWSHFSTIKYRRSFALNRLCLLKHNGKIWEEHTSFFLK